MKREVRTKYVGDVTIEDPDTKLPVTVEIRKLDNGLMVGLDACWLENIADDDPIFSPYAPITELIVPPYEVPEVE